MFFESDRGNYIKFRDPPCGRLEEARQVYTSHTYCNFWNDTRIMTMCHEEHITDKKKYAKKLNVPHFLTEFGACSNDFWCETECRIATDICERELVGWSYWQFKTYKDFTTLAGD